MSEPDDLSPDTSAPTEGHSALTTAVASANQLHARLPKLLFAAPDETQGAERMTRLGRRIKTYLEANGAISGGPSLAKRLESQLARSPEQYAERLSRLKAECDQMADALDTFLANPTAEAARELETSLDRISGPPVAKTTRDKRPGASHYSPPLAAPIPERGTAPTAPARSTPDAPHLANLPEREGRSADHTSAALASPPPSDQARPEQGIRPEPEAEPEAAGHQQPVDIVSRSAPPGLAMATDAGPTGFTQPGGAGPSLASAPGIPLDQPHQASPPEQSAPGPDRSNADQATPTRSAQAVSEPAALSTSGSDAPSATAGSVSRPAPPSLATASEVGTTRSIQPGESARQPQAQARTAGPTRASTPDTSAGRPHPASDAGVHPEPDSRGKTVETSRSRPSQAAGIDRRNPAMAASTARASYTGANATNLRRSSPTPGAAPQGETHHQPAAADTSASQPGQPRNDLGAGPVRATRADAKAPRHPQTAGPDTTERVTEAGPETAGKDAGGPPADALRQLGATLSDWWWDDQQRSKRRATLTLILAGIAVAGVGMLRWTDSPEPAPTIAAGLPTSPGATGEGAGTTRLGPVLPPIEPGSALLVFNAADAQAQALPQVRRIEVQLTLRDGSQDTGQLAAQSARTGKPELSTQAPGTGAPLIADQTGTSEPAPAALTAPVETWTETPEAQPITVVQRPAAHRDAAPRATPTHRVGRPAAPKVAAAPAPRAKARASAAKVSQAAARPDKRPAARTVAKAARPAPKAAPQLASSRTSKAAPPPRSKVAPKPAVAAAARTGAKVTPQTVARSTRASYPKTPVDGSTTRAPRYGVQIATATNPDGILEFARRYGLDPKQLYIERDGDLTIILLGAFDSMEKARKAMANLPSDLLQQRPYVRTFSRGVRFDLAQLR